MFRFKTTEGKELAVKFRYEREEVPAKPNDPNSKAHIRPKTTHCFIKDGDTTIAEGTATCHYQEMFSYAGGRKYALKRALMSAAFNAVNREKAWKGLFEMK